LLLTVLIGAVSGGLAYAAEDYPTQPITHLYDLTGGGAAGGLSLPSDVAVRDNRVYVVDSGNHRVVVFDSQGNYLQAIGVEGEQTGQFNYPLGIDAGPDGRIYIADRNNLRIQIFTSQGRYQNSFPVTSGGNRVHPIDIAMDPEGEELFVTGNDNHHVMVFTPEGKPLREWGGSGLGQGEFRYPGTLAFLQDGRLAVVDILNTRIQVFNQDGSFSLEIGEWGVLHGQLFRPKGIALDASDQIYVSDSYLNQIQVFSDTGQFEHVLRITDQGRKLQTPSGIAIDTEHRLYVAEMLGNRVSVFQLQQ